MLEESEELRQVCFVDMPFGRKTSTTFLGEIDFDDVYLSAIKPAVEKVGLLCIRGDEEIYGGIIHHTMFARLVLSEFVIADLTMSNPNVFYELGVRHAARPRTTIPIFAAESYLPFDVALVRAIPYHLTDGRMTDEAADTLQQRLVSRLSVSLEEMTATDSPIFQLLEGYKGPVVSSESNRTIRNRLLRLKRFRMQLKAAGNDHSALKQLELSLGDLKTIDANLVVELFNSYYLSSDYAAAFDLYNRMPVEAKELPNVRVRLAMVLMRTGRATDALAELSELQQTHGSDPQLFGMRGRIFMELYRRYPEDSQDGIAFLERASEALVKGFMLDPTDTYLGINALRALMNFNDSEHQEQYLRLLPVVFFAAERRKSINSEDPWAVASLLELAIMSGNLDEALRAASQLCSLHLDFYVLHSLGSELEMHLRRTKDKEKSEVLTEIIEKLEDRRNHSLR